MDLVNKITGSESENKGHGQGGGGGGKDKGIMDTLNSVAGGGKSSEKSEDSIDKGVDWVQENVMGEGKQNNESAVEQAKDEQISDFIRDKYKSTTGSDAPIKDKDRF